jgi:hypothetical protein
MKNMSNSAININLPFDWRGEGERSDMVFRLLNHPSPRQLSGNFICCYEKESDSL